MMKQKMLVVFITTPGLRASEKLTEGLLKNRWGACVNQISGLTSRYWWKGKIETAREDLLIVKTLAGKWPGLQKWVRAHHPYSVCEIVALPASAVSPPYLKWVWESLSPKRR